MTDYTAQQHAEAIKAAAQRYYDAVAAAEGDGWYVDTEALTCHAIGDPKPHYIVTVTLTGSPATYQI